MLHGDTSMYLLILRDNSITQRLNSCYAFIIHASSEYRSLVLGATSALSEYTLHHIMIHICNLYTFANLSTVDIFHTIRQALFKNSDRTGFIDLIWLMLPGQFVDILVRCCEVEILSHTIVQELLYKCVRRRVTFTS
jgi:hypothetical protein